MEGNKQVLLQGKSEPINVVSDELLEVVVECVEEKVVERVVISETEWEFLRNPKVPYYKDDDYMTFLKGKYEEVLHI